MRSSVLLMITWYKTMLFSLISFSMKKLSNKLERCYNSQVTFEHMLNNKRSYGDMSGIGFNKSKIKGKRWGKRRYEREMKKQEQEKLSHFMSFKCHEVGHLANGAPMKKSSS